MIVGKNKIGILLLALIVCTLLAVNCHSTQQENNTDTIEFPDGNLSESDFQDTIDGHKTDLFLLKNRHEHAGIPYQLTINNDPNTGVYRW